MAKICHQIINCRDLFFNENECLNVTKEVLFQIYQTNSIKIKVVWLLTHSKEST